MFNVGVRKGKLVKREDGRTSFSSSGSTPVFPNLRLQKKSKKSRVAKIPNSFFAFPTESFFKVLGIVLPGLI